MTTSVTITLYESARGDMPAAERLASASLATRAFHLTGVTCVGDATNYTFTRNGVQA